MMTAKTSDLIYLMWLRRIVQDHLRQAWNASDSDMDGTHEFLDDTWEQLDEILQKRLWGLSADLNTLRDRETCVESDWQLMTVDDLRREQEDARRRRQWDRLLELLRRPPRFRPRAHVDYLRGRAWLEMGHPDVALLFFDNAARIESDNASYRWLALECLKKSSNWEEALKRAEDYLKDDASSPRLFFRVADVFYSYGNVSRSAAYYRRAIEAVDRGLSKSELSGKGEVIQPILAGAYATKAFCLEHLGELPTALATLDEAIGRFSNDPLLYYARGTIKEALRRDDAVEDYLESINQGAAVVWPYLEAARISLEKGEFSHVARYCELGLQRTRDHTVAAVLFNLLAIARFGLGDAEAAKTAFSAAARLDPLNEDVLSNLQILKQQFSGPRSSLNWHVDANPSSHRLDQAYGELQPTF